MYGSLSQKNRDKFERVHKMAQRIVGINLPSYDEIFTERVLSKVLRVDMLKVELPCVVHTHLVEVT